MGDKTYNGWSNYETWRIANDIGNDKIDELSKDGERFESVSVLAKRIEEEVNQLVEDGASPSYRGSEPYVLQLARSFLQDVNWEEIAEGGKEELVADWECGVCGGDEFLKSEMFNESICSDCESDEFISA